MTPQLHRARQLARLSGAGQQPRVQHVLEQMRQGRHLEAGLQELSALAVQQLRAQQSEYLPTARPDSWSVR